MTKGWFYGFFLTVTFFLATSCQTLRRGDLLFHVTEEGNRITDVTPGMIDHVAIYAGSSFVIEAIPHCGVVTTPLDSLLQREQGYYIIGRVKQLDCKRSLNNASQYLGRDYDSLYLPDNQAIYCSELVQFSYVDRRGQLIFQPVPMSFHDASGRITDYWQQFYAHQGLPVPEGAPGTNPAEMSQRPQVKIRRK